ncbi:MAG TPA: hypothetical protein VH079_17110 [Terriglobales bacterium]|jgi:hypothetical protein|nr:hypothetical protein [Terriglobales bacterium]
MTTPSPFDYFNASNSVYGRSGSPPPGMTALTDAAGQPVTVTTANGVHGEAFLTGNGQVIIAFEGTAPNQIGDLGADAQILNGNAPRLANADAVRFAANVNDAARDQGISADNIFVTGHSLGGEQAEAVIAVNPQFGGGAAFGAPGLPGYNNSGEQPISGFTNYVNYGDPVANYGSDTSVGQALGLGASDHVGAVQFFGNLSDQQNLVGFANGLANSENNPDGPNVLFGLGGFAGGIGDHWLSTYGAKLGESFSPNTSNDRWNALDQTTFNDRWNALESSTSANGLTSEQANGLSGYNSQFGSLETQSPISYLSETQQYSQLASGNSFSDSIQQSVSLIDATNQSIQSGILGGSGPANGGFTGGGVESAAPPSTYYGNEFYGNDYGDLGGGDDGFGPVVLDLAGNGINITQLSSSNTFEDVTGSGTKSQTAWAGVGNGVLFVDPTGLGQLTQANQVVFTDWDPGATSDMQALLDVFDTNHDGMLDAGDTNFSKFFVMVTNADGTQSAQSLASLGITSINLNANATNVALADGSSIDGETTFTMTDPSSGATTTHTAATVTLAADSHGYAVGTTTTANADGSTTIANVASNADGSLAYERVLNTSAGGLSKTLTNLNNGGVVVSIQTDNSSLLRSRRGFAETSDALILDFWHSFQFLQHSKLHFADRITLERLR